jgi:cytochrome c oxidase subunit IV
MPEVIDKKLVKGELVFIPVKFARSKFAKIRLNNPFLVIFRTGLIVAVVRDISWVKLTSFFNIGPPFGVNLIGVVRSFNHIFLPGLDFFRLVHVGHLAFL